MELLLLIIIEIVMLKYIEKKSRVATIANAVVLIFFSVLIFYSSDSKVIAYIARSTMSESSYNILHSSLRSPLFFIRWGYSSYISIIFLLVFFTIIISTIFTVQTIRKYISSVEYVKYNDNKKKLKFFRLQQNLSKNKLYLKFGRFLS